jgi:DnaJ-class molecular chaperone
MKDLGDLGGAEFGGFSDFFRTFFGGGLGGFGGGFPEDLGGSPAPAVEHEMELSLEEVLRGATRTVELERGGSRRRVEVKIPAGVREGSRVRVAGEGARGARGGAGDLYLRVRLRPHPSFERKGDDLHTTLSVPLTTAVLGGEVQVPTLDGPVGIKVPPGTPAGRVFRLRGHGLPGLEAGGGRGDVLATLGVKLPKDLSRRERELFEELRRLGG